MKKIFLLLALVFVCFACGTSISTPEKDAQEVVNLMKKDLEKGYELFEEKLEIYASERGGPESKEFANQVTIKMMQL